MTAELDEVAALYQSLLESWNRRDAADFAGHFTANGSVIGFDGSPMNGSAEVEASVAPIFRDHPTAAYVAKVREVRLLAPGVALLRAVVGMVPPGASDINPAVNAMQMMVAVHDGGNWRIASYQNTPAAFHGRPEAAEALAEELRAELRSRVRPQASSEA